MRIYLVYLTLSVLASSFPSRSAPSFKYDIIGVIQLSSPSTWYTSGKSMLGSYWISSNSSTTSLAEASFVKASASMFSSLGIWKNSISLNFFTRRTTLLRYFFIRSSLASHVPFTWPMTNWESPKTRTDPASTDLASSNPLIRASYSASLLVV